MPVTILDAVEFSKIPSLQFVVPVVAADPTGYEAGLIYNSTSKEIKYHNGTIWVALGPAGAGGPPTGSAGGDLTGSYPSPQIAAGVIVDGDVATANKDGAAATPSMRTLGTGPNQAAPGNDARFTDARPPTGAAGGDLTGTYPNPTLAVDRVRKAGDTGIGTLAMAPAAYFKTDQLEATSAGTDIAVFDNIDFVSASKIKNMIGPTANGDGVNKQYCDLNSQGFSFKNPVRVVSTTNQAALSGLLTIDGVTLVANDRVLLAAQTTTTQNGIYVAAAGAWARSTDMDASGELKDGTLVPVAEGTTGQDTQWLCTSVGTAPWVPGTNTSVWVRQATLTDLVAGGGLTKTGTTIDVVSANAAHMVVNADNLAIVSAPKWTTPVSFSLTGDVTGSAASVDGSAAVSIATTIAGGSMAKHFAGDVPAGTSCVITHNLNTRDVGVTVYRNSSPYDTVLVNVERTSTTTVTLKFATAVSAGAFRCVVAGR